MARKKSKSANQTPDHEAFRHRDARRQVQQGGVSVNGRRLGNDELSVEAGEALHGAWFLIRKGGREVALVRC